MVNKMSRTAKTLISIIGIIAGTVILSVLAYYIGSVLGQSILTAGGMNHKDWENKYFELVIGMGGFSAIIMLAWYFLARFKLKVQQAHNIGQRTLWGIVGLIHLAVCFVYPYAVAGMDARFNINISIPLLFVLLYGIIGYWGGSIISTPAPFKYTPIGAMRIRAFKGRK